MYSMCTNVYTCIYMYLADVCVRVYVCIHRREYM